MVKERIGARKRLAKAAKALHRGIPKSEQVLAPALDAYFYALRRFTGPSTDVAIPHAISKRYGFVNPLLPKNASNMLGRFYRQDVAKEWDIELIEADPRDLLSRWEFKDYFVFAFVRNPWDRVLSLYLNKIFDPSFWVYYRTIAPFSGLRSGMPFEEFVDFLAGPEGTDEVADRHWLSQTRFLLDPEGRALYDFIGRVESFSQHWLTLQRRLRLPYVPSAKTNISTLNSEPAAFYSFDSWRKVGERYRADVEVFGYMEEGCEVNGPAIRE